MMTTKRTIVGILSAVALTAVTLAQQATTTRADMILSSVRTFHARLLELAKRFPQLKGIDPTQPDKPWLSFEKGVESRGKKEEPRYTTPDACLIYFKISDVAGITNRTVAAAERDIPQLGITVIWQCLANPDGPSASQFKTEVANAYSDCMTQLAKKLNQDTGSPTTPPTLRR